jgi:chorismate synthase
VDRVFQEGGGWMAEETSVWHTDPCGGVKYQSAHGEEIAVRVRMRPDKSIQRGVEEADSSAVGGG